ncbi:MAG: alanine racemase [Acidobacteria bacterium]|nr:alanine racemase [Acidobacteriota bacterium]
MRRRDLLKLAATAPVAALAGGERAKAQTRQTTRLRPGGSDDGFDPWVEVIAPAFRHNAAEVSRLAGGRPILAVIKNNAYGVGDQVVGPIVDGCPQVVGLACVRPGEALAMRAMGVGKPILTMAELGIEESAELVRKDVTLSCWLDDAGERLARIAKAARRRVPVHPYLDTGMNREGMPLTRALPWLENLARQPDIHLDGIYQMFVHDVEFDRVQLERFTSFLDRAAAAGIRPRLRHAAATFELHRVPESHLDAVRVGNALFGSPAGPDVAHPFDPKPVFRLRARVVRVERVEAGESAGFNRGFRPPAATSVALLPVGHTDGYASAAAGVSEVLIGDRTYPVVPGGVNSAHTIVDVGADPAVRVGDVATLIGPDHPSILPAEVGARTKTGTLQVMTRLSALLPRRVVEA